MKRRIISLALICIFLLPAFAVSAFAAINPRGNGYEAISFVYNGKNYSASLSTEFTLGSGARTKIYTEANVTVRLGAPTAEYETKGDGNVVETGLPAETILTYTNHMLATPYVQCRYGMNQVDGCNYIYGTGSVVVNGTSYSTTVYGTF